MLPKDLPGRCRCGIDLAASVVNPRGVFGVFNERARAKGAANMTNLGSTYA